MTAEQQRRIEENRKKALQKLAARKRAASGVSGSGELAPQPKRPPLRPPQSALSHYTAPASSAGCGSHEPRLEHVKTASSSSTSSRSSSSTCSSYRDGKGFFKGKGRGNKSSYTSLKTVITVSVVLASRTRFKVVVPYNAELIQLFKTIPSRSYGVKMHTHTCTHACTDAPTHTPIDTCRTRLDST